MSASDWSTMKALGYSTWSGRGAVTVQLSSSDTWPAARVIEAAYYENFDDDEYTDFTILRLTGSLDTFERADFGQIAFRAVPPSIAYRICCETREHTLKHYTFIQHSETSEGSFYFSPIRDILWLSCLARTLLSIVNALQILTKRCNKSLDSSKTLLVEDTEWDEGLPDKHTLRSFSMLHGLEKILLVADDYDEDSSLQLCSAEGY